MARPMAQQISALSYDDNAAHLSDELRRLDILIERRAMDVRRRHEMTDGLAAAKGVFISNEEFDALLRPAGSDEADAKAPRDQDRLTEFDDAMHASIEASLERGVFLGLPSLAARFALSWLERQAVVVCLAPELDRKYDTLYAYLQQDITRKRPSVDLVLDLICRPGPERWQARPVFSDQGSLFRTEILETVDDPRSPSGSSGLARFIKLSDRMLGFLLGSSAIDARLDGVAKVVHPEGSLEDLLIDGRIKEEAEAILAHHFAEDAPGWDRLIVGLHGPRGIGKRDLALGLCDRLGCPLLYVDMALLAARAKDIASMLRLAFREGLLQQGALYLDHLDRLPEEDAQAAAWLKTLTQVIDEYGWLTFLATEKPWSHPGVFGERSFYALEFAAPDAAIQRAAWERALALVAPAPAPAWPEQLVSRFSLTPGQIADAARWAERRRVMRHDARAPDLPDLYAACRHQSCHHLGELAVKIEPRNGWDDLVLPESALEQLREICSHVRHRHRVLGEWRFERKLSYGKGLSALFAGPSGTGKTMAAEVIANDLQLDLYKIDLSAVVSKYIGETEKNLARIFKEAESSNAILFFDEADALFGKRTKISDAHDRYANIETSYLLQKMEAYEGVTILATNFRENIDDAFTRRLRFLVDFPFPDAERRQQIWQRHFPIEAPTSREIDFAWLGRQLQIAGGNIKNIALSAAFLAAADGGEIAMEHVLRGAKREFEKMGKLWNDQELMPPSG
jgi:ATPase family associated with various cellular activities (AAA)